MMLSDQLSINLPLPNMRGEKVVERAKSEIKGLQSQNDELLKQIQTMKMNPKQIIEPFEKKLIQKIKALKRQNEGLNLIIEKSKYPGYIEMTKKKISNLTPQKNSSFEEENLLDDDYNHSEDKFPFHEPNHEKQEASTCFNYNPPQVQDPIESLQPLQDNQLRNRTILTAQVLQIVERSKHFKEEMQEIEKGNQRMGTAKYKKNMEKFRCLQHQKRKLLGLLQKLKSRQRNMNQLTNEYKLMYEETLSKLKQANQVLEQLQGAKIQQNIDDVYAQVLQLEQRLQYINEQLESLDQSGWLEQVYEELKKAILRIGLKVPEKREKQNLKESIDQLCQILIQCNLMHKKDEGEKINLLKYYHEEEKKNNKEVIKKMKEKEQVLSKKLVQMQMEFNKP